MKRFILTALSFLALSLSAQAAISTSVSFNSTTGIGGITSWPSTPTDASTLNPSTFTTAENNYGGSSLFSLGQSWTATQSGNLSRIQIAISGTAPVSFNLGLFDAGTSGWANIGSGTYNPGVNVSANLFSDTSIQTWSGYTLPSTTAAVLDFSLTGADMVSITAGRQYIFEISSTSNPNGMIWFRTPSDATDYANGQAFRQRSPLNGNAKRDMSLAVTVAPVPEPSVMALIGMGMFATTTLVRRRK